MRKTDQTKNNKGFSLVEIAVVITVGGLLLAGALSVHNAFQKQAIFDDTEARLDIAGEAIQLFFLENGRYPCPASLNLPADDPNNGREFCPPPLITAAGGPFPPPIPAIPEGTCDVSGICRVTGSRDADGNPATTDSVLIGGVPYKDLNTSLNMSTQDSYDGFLRRYTYVVTEELVQSLVPYDDTHGAIGVRAATDNSSNTMGSLVVVNNNTKFLILSHGDDGRGGFTADGVLRAACALPPASVDGENCDLDAIFIDSKAVSKAAGASDWVERNIRSTGNNANYYDDVLGYDFRVSSVLWTQSTIDTNDIYNTNAGNVGIGNQDPQERVHVEGSARFDQAVADTFCDGTGADCFPSSVIGGAGVSCGANIAMTGIAFNAPICDPLALQGVIAFTCPGSQYVNGVDALGNLQCGQP